MAAHREPIELDPNTTIAKRIETDVNSSGKGELRIGSHLYEVHRQEESSTRTTEESGSNIDLVIAAARAGKGSIDAEAMKRFIYEMRDREAEDISRIPTFE